jgi:hypothetical protein
MKAQIFIFIMFLFLNGLAQNASVYNYSLATNKITFFDIADDKNCGSFISGLNQSDNKLFVLHLNAMGDTLWAKTYDFIPYSPIIYDFKLSVSDSGIYFLAGKFNIMPPTNISYFILGKLDTLGNLIWAKSTKSSFYISSCIANDNDKVYCSFSSYEGDSLKLFKFDGNGNHLWRKSITIPSGFQTPIVSEIIFKNYDRVIIVGRISIYSNMANLGGFCLWVGKQNGLLYSLSRFYSTQNNLIINPLSNFNINHQIYMCGNASYSGIMVSKHNLGSSPSFTKHLYHDSINIRAKSIHLTYSNHLIITGNYINSNPPAGLHIELDTNLTMLNAYKYIDNDSNFSINFNKTINNCGINKTIGTISNNAMSKGYLLSKEFITDSVCNQEGLTINDSTYSDTVVFETPEEQFTNEWTNINYTQADIDFYKQNCLTINSLEENSTLIETYLYPNPTNTGNFKIESNEIIYSVELINLLGERISFESTVNNNSFNFHCSDLQSGIYFANIKYKSSTINKKVIIANH